MDSGMIGKIQKARMYAEEPERVQFHTFRVTFHGEHADHTVTYDEGVWGCTCRFFQTHHTCSHTMALERMLGEMLRAPDSVPGASL
ncbi:MAG: SWIM zinc finger family protein [Anaerolineae bacterium]|nr:SWIM zinc finger family protein [Anaerolineae bacterium]